MQPVKAIKAIEVILMNAKQFCEGRGGVRWFSDSVSGEIPRRHSLG